MRNGFSVYSCGILLLVSIVLVVYSTLLSLLVVLLLSFKELVVSLLFFLFDMTRTYCRQYSPGDTWSYDIVSRVYDKGELAVMFMATFDRDYKLVSLNLVNVSLPNPSVGTELQLFLSRAYRVCFGVDSGLLEFEFFR